MPAKRKEFPSESFDVQLSPDNMLALRTKFADPLSRRGVKYGAISKFIDGLVSDYFRANPIVSTAAIKEALNG